jgi:hypothetical protein
MAFISENLADRSAFFRPSDIGELPDDDEHSLIFRAGDSQAWFCSEPKRMARLAHEDIFAGRTGHRRTDRLRPLFEKLGNELIQVFEKPATKRDMVDASTRRLIDASRGIAGSSDPAEYASFLSLTLFGCELVVLDV